MNTTTWTVEGMTCQHCIDAVTEEVSTLPGVTAVAVDLEGGQVSITSEDALAVSDVAAAIDEAGYLLITN
ncbi:MAG: cation transporter [Actinomycetes bacterium]|jgi:copper ion binding protein